MVEYKKVERPDPFIRGAQFSEFRMPHQPVSSDPEAARLIEQSLDSVREALVGLRYGHIGITIHEGRVAQIDITEKRRLKTG